MSPVTLSVQVTKVETRLLAQRDISSRTRDLPRDKSTSTARALVVEQDPVARKHAVRLTVVHGDPIAIKLGDTVGGPGVERSRLALWGLDDLAVELGCRRLVEADVLVQPASTNSIEKTERAKTVDITCIFGHLK